MNLFVLHALNYSQQTVKDATLYFIWYKTKSYIHTYRLLILKNCCLLYESLFFSCLSVFLSRFFVRFIFQIFVCSSISPFLFFVNNFAPMDYLSLLYSYYGFLEVILNIQILEFKQLQLYGKING